MWAYPPSSTPEALAGAGLQDPRQKLRGLVPFPDQGRRKASGTWAGRPKLPRTGLLNPSPSAPKPYLWHQPRSCSSKGQTPPSPTGDKLL